MSPISVNAVTSSRSRHGKQSGSTMRADFTIHSSMALLYIHLHLPPRPFVHQINLPLKYKRRSVLADFHTHTILHPHSTLSKVTYASSASPVLVKQSEMLMPLFLPITALLRS